MAKFIRKLMAQELSSLLEKTDNFILFSYDGVSAEQIYQLRKKLVEIGVKVKVLKNNIAKLTCEEIYGQDVSEELKGPTAMAYGGETPVDIAKTLFDWNKKKKLIKIKGGILAGQAIDKSQVEELSKVPSKEVLLSMLAYSFEAPIQSIATVLNGGAQNVSNIFNNYIQKLEDAEG